MENVRMSLYFAEAARLHGNTVQNFITMHFLYDAVCWNTIVLLCRDLLYLMHRI